MSDAPRDPSMAAFLDDAATAASPPATAASHTTRDRASQLVDDLLVWDVRVVVWDMDHTMSNQHCGAGLPRTALDSYLDAVSPDFVRLVKALVACPVRRFRLAVATGSDEAEYELEGQSRETHILG